MKILDNNRILTRVDSPYPLVLHPKASKSLHRDVSIQQILVFSGGAVQILDSGQCTSN